MPGSTHPRSEEADREAARRIVPGLSSALQLEEAIIRHPKLRIYAVHAGWPLIDDCSRCSMHRARSYAVKFLRLEPEDLVP